MTTIATPITGTVADTSSRKNGHLWIAFLVGAVALATLVVATFVIVRSTNSSAPVVSARHAVSDPVAHGTAGHVFTTDGLPISPAQAATESDLLVHGGPGSAVTLSGERLR